MFTCLHHVFTALIHYTLFCFQIQIQNNHRDPDLYVARDLADNRVVNKTFWKWRSRRFGRDVIAIPIRNSTDLGVYQIGVYSYSLTEYRLTAWMRTVIYNVTDSGSPQKAMSIFEGQTRYDFSQSGTSRCYVFAADGPENEELEINLQVHEGTVNCYIEYDNVGDGAWDHKVVGISDRAGTKMVTVSAGDLQEVDRYFGVMLIEGVVV